MRRMFRISVDAARSLVSVTLSGTMTVDEVTEYIDALRDVIVRHRLATRYRIVIDATACTIQTQEAVRTMGERMAAMPRAQSIAVVAGSALARMQIRRLFSQDYARVVASVEAGRAWVLDGVEPADEMPATGVAGHV